MTRRPFFQVLLSAGGVSLVSQAVALLRQILLVSAFGLSRDLDLYSTALSILSISTLLLASVIDSIFVSEFSKIKAKEGSEAFKRALSGYLWASILISLVAVATLALLFPVLLMLFAAGFDADARESLVRLAPYCLPWALLVIPYAAICAWVKCAWNYRVTFVADLLVALASTMAIFLWHESISDALLAFGYGYLAGVSFLLASVGRQARMLEVSSFPWREFAARMVRHVASAQVGTLVTFAERFWFSYLPPGGIAAMALVQQLTMSLTGLLSFRDAYLVPLADFSGRGIKLSRLMLGLFLVAVAAAAGVIALADPLCRLLFEYGKAAARDSELIAQLLAISMGGMVVSVVATPVWRLQQMMAVYRPLTLVYLGLATSTMLLGYVTVALLNLGTIGMAGVSATNACGAAIVAMLYARQLGARLERKGVWLAWYFLLSGFVAGFVANRLASLLPGSLLLSLLGGGVAYTAILSIFAYTVRYHVLELLHGRTR